MYSRRFAGTYSLDRANLLQALVSTARRLPALRAQQLVHHRDNEQGVPAGALVNQLRQACRQLRRCTSLTQIRCDGGCRQGIEHQLDALGVRPQRREEEPQRMLRV